MSRYFDYFEDVNFKDDVQTINDDGFIKLTDMLEELLDEILDCDDGRSLLNKDSFNDIRSNIKDVLEEVINKGNNYGYNYSR